jgi:chromosome segregation ATPase
MDQLTSLLDLNADHAAYRRGLAFEQIQEAQDEAVAGLRGQLRRRAAELNAAKDEIKALKSDLALALLKADAAARLVGRQAGTISDLEAERAALRDELAIRNEEITGLHLQLRQARALKGA